VVTRLITEAGASAVAAYADLEPAKIEVGLPVGDQLGFLDNLGLDSADTSAFAGVCPETGQFAFKRTMSTNGWIGWNREALEGALKSSVTHALSVAGADLEKLPDFDESLKYSVTITIG